MHNASVVVIGLRLEHSQSESMPRSGDMANPGHVSGSAASGTGVPGGSMEAGTGKHVLPEQQADPGSI